MPPEQLARALLLQALSTVRSERLLIEQPEYNLLFPWFVGLAMDAPGLGADDLHQEPHADGARATPATAPAAYASASLGGEYPPA